MNSVIETLERMTLLVPQNLTRASNRLPDCFLTFDVLEAQLQRRFDFARAAAGGGTGSPKLWERPRNDPSILTPRPSRERKAAHLPLSAEASQGSPDIDRVLQPDVSLFSDGFPVNIPVSFHLLVGTIGRQRLRRCCCSYDTTANAP